MPLLATPGPAGRRRPPLSVTRLEERELPAGNIIASISKGVLTLTGDDAANVVTVLVTAASVTLTPDATTSINGGTAGTAATINGSATGLSAKLAGGADQLSIDPASAFSLTGAASIDLGDGNNTLNLVTTAKISLPSLAVKAGDGADVINIQGGTGLGSAIAGTTSFTLGFGDVTGTWSDVAFNNAKGITLAASDGTDAITGTNLSVAGLFTATLPNSTTQLTFNTSTLAGLKESAYIPKATLKTVTDSGPISLAGVADATFTANPATVNSTLSVATTSSASTPTVTFKGGTTSVAGVTIQGGTATLTIGAATTDAFTSTGNVKITGARAATLTVSKGTMTAPAVSISSTGGTATANAKGTSLTVNGAVALSSALAATVTVSAGTFSAASLAVTSKARDASVTAGGTSATIGGPVTISGAQAVSLTESAGTFTGGATKMTSSQNTVSLATSGGTSVTVNSTLTVTGKLGTSIAFATTNLSEVTGAISVTGGENADTFTASHQFKADQGITLKLGGGANAVALGDSGGTLDLVGGLSIATGSGADTISLLDVAIGGAVSVAGGSGSDTLTIDDGSVFAGTVKIDMGGGDDTVAIAQNKGQASGVKFNGVTTILGNTGDDTLLAGLTAAGGGDANSAVTFAAGSVLDGGTGLNTLGTNPQQSGATEKNGW